MSASFLTQGHHVVYICSNVIFQILLLYSRPMTSHHVTCHVTAMSCASSLSLKRKIKIKIKLRKIDKRKRKMLVFKAFHNTSLIFIFIYVLHAITNPVTFDKVPLNIWDLATLVLAAILPMPSPTYTVSAAICS